MSKKQTSFPWAWVRKVDQALAALGQIPAEGYSPPFDFDGMTKQLAEHFSAPDLSVEQGDCQWRKAGDVKEGLGSNPLELAVSVLPLSQTAYWLMPRADVAALTSWLLNGNARSRPISSEILQEGFYRYLALEALSVLQSQEPLSAFSLKLSDEGFDVEEHDAFCVDIQLSLPKRSCWGRLIVPAPFMTSWRRHFSSLSESFALSPLAKSLEIPLGIKVGSVSLTMKEWKSLEKGDFVVLDRGSYDPRHKEGNASLMLGSTPLFQLSLKHDKIKVIETALIHEEDMAKREETLKETPVLITVELARLTMTVEELMKLSPGHFIELPTHPNQGVDLTVNGSKVGRAELIYLGDALGLRILETAE